jgi:hypothetical protein
MNDLLAFLSDSCCNGQACLPALQASNLRTNKAADKVADKAEI